LTVKPRVKFRQVLSSFVKRRQALSRARPLRINGLRRVKGSPGDWRIGRVRLRVAVALPAPLDGLGHGVVSPSPALKAWTTAWGARSREIASSLPIAA
jgi:hypothetical protein